MNKVNYLIIGGGIAGTTTAEFIRMHDSSGSILIVMEEPELLYSRVLLPHFLRDQVSFERLYIRKEEHYREKNIKLVKGIKVNKVNTQKGEVELDNGEIIRYGKLHVASGVKVNQLDIPGKDLKGITYMRTVADVKQIKELMENAKNGVVIGGGFIGIEFAQTFVKFGIKTTSIMRDPYFWSHVIGENMGKLISQILQKNGVEIIAEDEPKEFVGSGILSQIKLKSGKSLSADIAGVGIGVHIDLNYLKESGIKINKGVITNEFLETNVENVWASGDVAEFNDTLFDKHHLLGNWSNAAAQGKVAGSNMVVGWGLQPPTGGGREKFETVSAYTIGIFDNSFTFMGDPTVDKTIGLIERGSWEENKLGRIHIRNGVITGVALLNLPADRRPIENLIKNRVNIEASKGRLADSSFNLNKLLEN